MKILPLKKGWNVDANVAYYPKPLRWWNFREKKDLLSLFGGEDVMITRNPKFLDLLVNFGAFNNNAEARNAGYTNEMPPGFSQTKFCRHPTPTKRGYYQLITLFNAPKRP